VLVTVLDAIVRLIQPVMPFLAESIWQALAKVAPQRGLPEPHGAAESVVIAAWPKCPESWRDPAIEARMARMQELVRGIREVRNRYTIDPATKLSVSVRCRAEIAADFAALTPFITQLAGVGDFTCGPDAVKPKQATSTVTPDFEAYVSLAGLIDVAKEAERVEKLLAEKRKFLGGTKGKLSNASFVDRAPAEVVQQQRDLVTDLENQIRTMEDILAELRK
jgi:valyl-tRNA synthetase